MLKLSDTVLQPIQELCFNQATHKAETMVEVLSAALKLDCALEQWHSSLPGHLVPGYPCSQGQTTFRRQAIILRMRYV